MSAPVTRAALLALLLVAQGATAGEVSLVYSGGFQGFAPPLARFELQARLAGVFAEAGREVTDVSVISGLIAQDDLELWPDDGLPDSALAFAADPSRTCDDGVLVTTWRTPTERFLPGPHGDALPPDVPVRDAREEIRRYHRCEGGGSAVTALVEPHAPPPDQRTLDAPSLRVGTRWTTPEGRYYQLSHPRREAARRVGTIRAAVARTPGAMYADAGDFLEPGPVDDPLWREARTLGFDVLESLDPVALVPGASELALGPQALADEAAARGLPYVATNWRRDDGEDWFPRVVRHEFQAGEQTIDVALLGVTDPDRVAWLPPEATEGLTLLDPLEAVAEAVDSMASDRPDLVVLLVNPTARLLEDLRRRLYGVDALLGDPAAATYRVGAQYTELRSIGGSFKAAPITLPLDGIALASVSLDDGVSGITVEPLEVTSTSPADRYLTGVLTDLHLRRARFGPAPLIAPDTPLSGVSEARWEKLVCEALIERTGADAAYLDGLPYHLPSPGPLTEGQIAQRLDGEHLVEVHRVDGDRLRRFLVAAEGKTAIHCGASGLRVAGRFIDPLRTYRVATTARTRRGPLGPLLADATSNWVGHRPSFKPVRSPEGRLRLDEAVIDTLRAADPEQLGTWTARDASTLRPQVLLNIYRLGLRVTRFEGAKTDAYQEVPETLINSPSSFTLGGDVDVALELSSKALLADVRVRAAYERFVIDGLPPQETADDWIVSSSLEAPVLGPPPLGWLTVRPFVEAALDSEFTPGETDDGTVLPRQADLSAFGGVAFGRGPWLRTFRFGPFVNRDLGRLTDKGTEYGLRWTGSTFHLVNPLSFLNITTAWDVSLFGDTPQDDAADLRLRMFGEVRASFRLLRFLRLGFFAQGLLVQGRVAETQRVAGSLTLGAAFDLAAAIRLDARPRLFP